MLRDSVIAPSAGIIVKLNQVTQLVDTVLKKLPIFVIDVKVDGINTKDCVLAILLELTFVSQGHRVKD